MHTNKELFLSALQYTTRMTGFSSLLIEKDYYCSLCLRAIFDQNSTLVFKGGTLLNKVHCGFYRLSEDLDFLISLPSDATRGERSKAAGPIKSLIKNISEKEQCISISEELTGFNQSKQYIAKVEYQSLVTARPETIKIDVGLRENVLTKPSIGNAQTILLNPLREQPALKPFDVQCLSLEEAFAEKIRAALTRNPPAIRDFFDLAFATSKLSLDFLDESYLTLVQNKVSITEDIIDVSDARKEVLARQLETELKPVLRSSDYDNFDFDKSFQLARNLADKMTSLS